MRLDNTARIIETLLQKVGFTRFGLYVQDYGGPLDLRIVGRHPEWLDSPHAEMHRLDSGHFAIEDSLSVIRNAMIAYHAKHIAR